MIASYNYDAMGDVLVIVLAPNAEKQSVMTVEQVTRIQNDETNEATRFIYLKLQNGKWKVVNEGY